MLTEADTDLIAGMKYDIDEINNIGVDQLIYNFPIKKAQLAIQKIPAIITRLNNRILDLRIEQNGAQLDRDVEIAGLCNRLGKLRANLMYVWAMLSNPHTFQNYLKYYTIIQRDCGFAFEAMAKSKILLYRGVTGKSHSAFISSPVPNRYTKDTPGFMQERIDKVLNYAGFKALRSNSIYTTPRRNTAAGYGSDVFLIFPIDGFHFTWCRHNDLYVQVLDKLKIYEFDTFVSKLLDINSKDQVKKDSVCMSLNERMFEVRDVIRNKINVIDRKIHLKGNEKTINDIAYIAIYQNYQNELYGVDFKFRGYDMRETSTVENIKTINVTLRCLETMVKDQRTDWYADEINVFKRAIDALRKALFFFMTYNEDPLKDLTPEIVRTQLQKEHGFNDTDFLAGLESDNEILINGKYYAFRLDKVTPREWFSSNVQSSFEPSQLNPGTLIDNLVKTGKPFKTMSISRSPFLEF